MIRAALLVVGLLSVGCGKEKFSCDDERQGNWAIRIFEDPNENGECSTSGSVVFEDGTESKLSCDIEDDQCVCSAGTDFGIYEIIVVDRKTGKTDRAVVEVEAAPSPDCVTRDTIETFAPVGPPPAGGGAGGANN